MAKLEIRTSDADIHSKATLQNIPHRHSREGGYTNMQVWFDFDVDEKTAITKGFSVNASENVHLGYTFSDEGMAEMLAEANFDPISFLDKLAEAKIAKEAERKQRELEDQREREEKQRRDFAKKSARELLADEFKELKNENEDLKSKIKRKEDRISDLEGYLHKLIMAASEPALQRAGLVKPQDEAEEEEEPTPEQQEALETTGLDC